MKGLYSTCDLATKSGVHFGSSRLLSTSGCMLLVSLGNVVRGIMFRNNVRSSAVVKRLSSILLHLCIFGGMGIMFRKNVRSSVVVKKLSRRLLHFSIDGVEAEGWSHGIAWGNDSRRRGR